MPALPRKCSNCDHWRRGRRRWDGITQSLVWVDENFVTGSCYGVEPSIEEKTFPETHEDKRYPNFTQIVVRR